MLFNFLSTLHYPAFLWTLKFQNDWFLYGLFWATKTSILCIHILCDRYVICEFLAPKFTLDELLISTLVSNFAEKIDKN